MLTELRIRIVQRGQAVHKFRVRVVGCSHEAARHLVGKHQLDAFAPEVGGFAHRDPDIGVQEVASSNRCFDILCQGDTRSGLPGDGARQGNAHLPWPA